MLAVAVSVTVPPFSATVAELVESVIVPAAFVENGFTACPKLVLVNAPKSKR